MPVNRRGPWRDASPMPWDLPVESATALVVSQDVEQRGRELIRGSVLPRCYQNTPYQDDLGRHAASSDRFGLFGLGLLGCEYLVQFSSSSVGRGFNSRPRLHTSTAPSPSKS
jgi:hypothetical protein